MACDFCEEKDEKIRQLESQLFAKDYVAPQELRLVGSQERILGLLLRHDRYVSIDTIFEGTRDIPGARAKERGEKLIPTMISKLRTKLAPFDMQINTVWGVGYRLDSKTRQRLLHWNEPAEQAA